jgi:hypothetical protein
MHRLLAFALVAAVASVPARAQPSADKAIAASGSVWIMGTDGGLYEWRDSVARRATVSGSIVDITRSSEGTLLVLRKPTANGDDVLIERTEDGRWQRYAAIRVTRLDQLLGFAVHGDLAAIVTAKVILLARRGDSAVRIAHGRETIGPSYRVSAALTADSNLYVGRLRTATPHEGVSLRIPLPDGTRHFRPPTLRNGLLRIDLRTGRNRFVGGTDSDAIDIITDPNNPRCVVASMGSASFVLWTSSIVRACGDALHEILPDPCGGDGTSESCHFGQIASDVNGFWVITSHGVARFSEGDRRMEYAWPERFRVEAKPHSVDIPGLLIIRDVATLSRFKQLIVALRVSR